MFFQRSITALHQAMKWRVIIIIIIIINVIYMAQMRIDAANAPCRLLLLYCTILILLSERTQLTMICYFHSQIYTMWPKPQLDWINPSVWLMPTTNSSLQSVTLHETRGSPTLSHNAIMQPQRQATY